MSGGFKDNVLLEHCTPQCTLRGRTKGHRWWSTVKQAPRLSYPFRRCLPTSLSPGGSSANTVINFPACSFCLGCTTTCWGSPSRSLSIYLSQSNYGGIFDDPNCADHPNHLRASGKKSKGEGARAATPNAACTCSFLIRVSY